LYRGTDGSTGKYIAKAIRQARAKGLTEVLIDDSSLVGYTSDVGVARSFGTRHGGINVELQVKKEPKLALVGGSEDGLDLIRMIIEQSPNYLVDGGALLIECDYRQNDLVASLLKEGGFSAVGQKEDLANVRRIVWGYYYA